MRDLAPILPKLGRLIPRLASDQDGEVVATARAIDRTLRGAGADWFDVVNALGDGAEPKPAAAGPPTLRAMADWCAARGDDARLSLKDFEFVLAMARLLRTSRRPSEKQATWLRDVFEKLGGRDAR